MSLEAMKQALEALEYIYTETTEDEDELIHAAIPALRLAIEQAERQEPTTVEDNSQNWKGMDGATAWHLIHRHADGWPDVQKMMEEWLAANQTAQEKQEPVAWGYMHNGVVYDCICPAEHERVAGEYTVPLYTAPPQRQPLTDDELEELEFASVDRKYGHLDVRALARAIERALGGEK